MEGAAPGLEPGLVPMPEAQWLKHGDRRVPRELFPLPSLGRFVVEESDISRSVRRRLERKQHVADMVEDCIAGLNALYSGGPVGVASSQSVASAAQMKVLDHVLNSVKQLGPPPMVLTVQERLSSSGLSMGMATTRCHIQFAHIHPSSYLCLLVETKRCHWKACWERRVVP